VRWPRSGGAASDLERCPITTLAEFEDGNRMRSLAAVGYAERRSG
jgi:hypothetical protein